MGTRWATAATFVVEHEHSPVNLVHAVNHATQSQFFWPPIYQQRDVEILIIMAEATLQPARAPSSSAQPFPHRAVFGKVESNKCFKSGAHIPLLPRPQLIQWPLQQLWRVFKNLSRRAIQEVQGTVKIFRLNRQFAIFKLAVDTLKNGVVERAQLERVQTGLWSPQFLEFKYSAGEKTITTSAQVIQLRRAPHTLRAQVCGDLSDQPPISQHAGVMVVAL